MCTFKSDEEAMVCDVAIGAVRSRLDRESFRVEFSTVEGQGTLVKAQDRAIGAKAASFRDTVQSAIETATQAHATRET